MSRRIWEKGVVTSRAVIRLPTCSASSSFVFERFEFASSMHCKFQAATAQTLKP